MRSPTCSGFWSLCKRLLSDLRDQNPRKDAPPSGLRAQDKATVIGVRTRAWPPTADLAGGGDRGGGGQPLRVMGEGGAEVRARRGTRHTAAGLHSWRTA